MSAGPRAPPGIKQWKFTPAVKNGQPVAVRARQTFIFEDPSVPSSPKRDVPATQSQPAAMIANAK